MRASLQPNGVRSGPDGLARPCRGPSRASLPAPPRPRRRPPVARRRCRGRQQEALPQPDALGAQPLELLLGLDALGDDRDAHAPGEAGDGADQVLVLRAPTDPAHELLVDLQVADGEPVERGERGVSLAEVVEGHTQAHVAGAFEDAGGGLHVGDGAALGDLHTSSSGGRRVSSSTRARSSRAPDRRGLGREVDADVELVAGARATGELPRRVLERPAVEQPDEAGVLGQRDELPRAERRAAGAASA